MQSTRFPLARQIPFLALFFLCAAASCTKGPICASTNIQVTKTADTNDGSCTGVDCSLREAVIHSNFCPGKQTIFLGPGTYTLTRAGIDEDAASTGDLDLTDSVDILGSESPVIDGNASDRIFEVHDGVSARLYRLVIQNGLAEFGAGIWSRNATLNVDESVIRDNHTTPGAERGAFRHGGGILSQGNGALGVDHSEVLDNSGHDGGGIAVEAEWDEVQSVTISHTMIKGNTAGRFGGGISLWFGADAELIHVELEENTAVEDGGGIYSTGDLELTSSTVERNRADNGGGLYNDMYGTLIARDTMVSENEAGAGGGILNTGTLNFSEGAIVYNTGNYGGGANNLGGMVLRNTTLGGNSAAFRGGGVYNNNGGSFTAIFSTIANNAVEGIHSVDGRINLVNTIIGANAVANCVGDAPVSLGFNIDTADTCGLAAAGDLSHTNPMLDLLPPAGTWSPVFALQAGSPAIDSADPGECSGTDQRGVIRPKGFGCDRGAFERDLSDGGDGSIGGIVWHDLCAVPNHGYPPTPPPGCSDPDGNGIFADANGILEEGEPGFPDITLHLKRGSCATAVDVRTAATGADGRYSFDGLAAGTYCITVDAFEGDNGLLIPGNWTYPNLTYYDTIQQTEVILGEGEARTDVNFGWDFQFLPGIPDYLTPTPTPALLSFGKPEISTDKLYFYGPNSRSDCGPKEVKFQIGLSSSEGVANVLFYARLKEQSSGRIGAWTEGVSMTPLGNNQYEVTLWAENIPDVRTFGESWLQYQFVALDAAGQALVRSEVFWNVTVLRCEYKPK